MSFLSHIGLSVIDKVTGNALDKIGNAIKDGDVKEITNLFRGILEGVEDKVGEISEHFEDMIESAKKDVRREVNRVKRRLVRETRQEMEQLSEDFGERMAEVMEPKIAEMVKAEVARRMAGDGNGEEKEKA